MTKTTFPKEENLKLSIKKNYSMYTHFPHQRRMNKKYKLHMNRNRRTDLNNIFTIEISVRTRIYKMVELTELQQ